MLRDDGAFASVLNRVDDGTKFAFQRQRAHFFAAPMNRNVPISYLPSSARRRSSCIGLTWAQVAMASARYYTAETITEWRFGYDSADERRQLQALTTRLAAVRQRISRQAFTTLR